MLLSLSKHRVLPAGRLIEVSVMEKNSRIFVAGHRGMVGSAIVRELEKRGYSNIVTRSSKELDLRRQADVEDFFAEQ